MASRVDRIKTIIFKNITEIIQFKLKDPRLGFVTVCSVKVSDDFSHAKVFVSFIMKENEKTGLEILNASKGFIRCELAKTLDTRRVPEISFELDTSYDDAKRIDDIIDKANNKKK